mmetsp:Transcript_4175/g.10194  ORF Transcript_4175/g.10194 Transcript_4175/m.10194 type:complete len:137 (+) Transcript_4175:882-1292(+)
MYCALEAPEFEVHVNSYATRKASELSSQLLRHTQLRHMFLLSTISSYAPAAKIRQLAACACMNGLSRVLGSKDSSCTCINGLSRVGTYLNTYSPNSKSGWALFWHHKKQRILCTWFRVTHGLLGNCSDRPCGSSFF